MVGLTVLIGCMGQLHRLIRAAEVSGKRLRDPAIAIAERTAGDFSGEIFWKLWRCPIDHPATCRRPCEGPMDRAAVPSAANRRRRTPVLKTLMISQGAH